jgi:DNA repair protein RadD
MSKLSLRDYQSAAIEKLRQGFAQGHRTQMLVSPTGSGKTEIAIAMLEATMEKGNKAAMLLDRIVLCDQTSKRLEKYSIAHGVLQSGHWRYRPYEHIQVCSAQTLERRGNFPGLNLLIVDEAHTTRKQTIEFIKNNPDVRVVGLSATPFTKGLGKVYSNVVSPITTRELVDQGKLVPLRVFIAKEIDMTGAKKVAGEWSQAETTERGMKVTGDVVAEWVKKTHEIFGEPKKTIVFSAGVDHGADLARKFQEQGYNFVSLSYRDDDEWKKEIIEDFSKPDSDIIGLVATDILTKGFDNEEVMIGVSARPFSKSFSSHVQQMGRVMRANQTNPEAKPFSLWLDHSGNYLRFREDWEKVYGEGVAELDDGMEKPKPEPTEREKKECKCPRCSALWPANSDTCFNCGHVRERQNKVIAVAGEMEELKGAMSRESKQEFWNQMVYLMRYEGWNNGRAANTYKDKFGVWPRGLSDGTPKPVSPETKKFINKRLYAFMKKMGKR